MEFNGFIILAAVWFLLSLVTRSGKKSLPRAPSQRPKPRPLATTLDPTQREGSRIEIMLGEFQRALKDANQQRRIRTYNEDEGSSLEQDVQTAKRENMAPRPRREVDQDDEAEGVVARRINAALTRDHTPAERPGIDPRIQQQPADNTRARTYTPQQLRDAMIWREILDPPVSLRRETDFDS